jgi:hypothetical protein
MVMLLLLFGIVPIPPLKLHRHGLFFVLLTV